MARIAIVTGAASGRLAQDVLRGIDRNAAVVIAPASAQVAWRLWQYAPVLVNDVPALQLAWRQATFPARSGEPAGGHDAGEPTAARGGAGDD